MMTDTNWAWIVLAFLAGLWLNSDSPAAWWIRKRLWYFPREWLFRRRCWQCGSKKSTDTRAKYSGVGKHRKCNACGTTFLSCGYPSLRPRRDPHSIGEKYLKIRGDRECADIDPAKIAEPNDTHGRSYTIQEWIAAERPEGAWHMIGGTSADPVFTILPEAEEQAMVDRTYEKHPDWFPEGEA